MRILILGSTGFIGQAIFQELVAEHEVTIASRKRVGQYAHWRPVDFSKPNDWEALVSGIDLIINAIGIISGDFTKIQTTSPKELFAYCAQQKVKIINISAIGAERANPPNPFLGSKKQLDNFLIDLPDTKIIYPGIVLGPEGKSSRFFKAISIFPVIPLMGGDPPLVHISQLTNLVKEVVADFDRFPTQVFAIAKAETMSDLYTALRGKRAIYFSSPSWPVRLIFGIFPKLEIGIFNKNMVTMIDKIDVSNYQPNFDRKATSFIEAKQVKPSNDLKRAFGFLSLFIVWMWSGVSSLVSWSESEVLMSSIGIEAPGSTSFIYLGSIVDILLALGLFLRKHRRKVLFAQLAFIAVYTLILTIFAPEFWMHPFGVLTKNIPLIGIGWWLLEDTV